MRQTYKLVVGLGNPGEEYENTRHNAGFMVVDSLIDQLPGAFSKEHLFASYYWKGRSKGSNLFLQKPLTFMNLSGKSVKKLMLKEKIDPTEIVVVFDDLDIPFGKMRIKVGGGSGGHNGVQSVIDELGSANFVRVRIGIGKQEGKYQAGHVLDNFNEEETLLLPKVLKAVSDAVKMIIYSGSKAAMNKYNGLEIK